MTHEEKIQKYFDEYIVPKDLDVYGFLKHYRDLMSWSEPLLTSIGTTDAMIILEKYYRQKIAQEIENMRMTIVSGMGGITNHSLDECRDLRKSLFQDAQKMFASVARGTNDPR